MKLSILAAAAAVALSAGLASADALDPTSTTICLDSGGRQAPVRCRQQQASRLNHEADICICPAATMQVKAPICPAGVKPPGESAAYERARRQAVKNGSLAGAVWQGQPICVAPRG